MNLDNIIARAMQVVKPEQYEADLEQRINTAKAKFADYCVHEVRPEWLRALIIGELQPYVVMKCVEQIEANDRCWTLRREPFDYLFDGTRNTDRWRFTYTGEPQPISVIVRRPIRPVPPQPPADTSSQPPTAPPVEKVDDVAYQM